MAGGEQRQLRATGDEPLEVVNSGADDWVYTEEPVRHVCVQRVPSGGPFCTQEAKHRLDTNYGFLGWLCDEHWAALTDALPGFASEVSA